MKEKALTDKGWGKITPLNFKHAVFGEIFRKDSGDWCLLLDTVEYRLKAVSLVDAVKKAEGFIKPKQKKHLKKLVS